MSTSKTDRQYAAIHFYGPNRIGIQDQVAEFVGRFCDNNIIKNDVELLGAEAVVLFLVECSEEQLKLMEIQLPGWGKSVKLDTFFKRTSHVELPSKEPPEVIEESVQSEDFPGLLKRLTVLAVKHDLDIISHHGEQSTLPGANPLSVYGQDITFRMKRGLKRKASLEKRKDFGADWLALKKELRLIP